MSQCMALASGYPGEPSCWHLRAAILYVGGFAGQEEARDMPAGKLHR